MKNDWELYIKDENKNKWRKIKHIGLNVNRRWGLDASKVTCSVKNTAGYNFDWIKDSTEAKLYKNGKFFLYLHITKLTPSRTPKTSILNITFEDYWYFRLRKQLTPSETYGDLMGIPNHRIIKMALGTETIIQDRFDSTKHGLSITTDNYTLTKEQTIQSIPEVGNKTVEIEDASVYMVGEAVTLSPSILMTGGEETKVIESIDLVNDILSFYTPIVREHKVGNTVGCKVTANVNIVIRNKGERPDGYIELAKGLGGKYVPFGRIQSVLWRKDEPTWQRCEEIEAVQLVRDDSVSGNGSLAYYFSRDDGETWYDITTWTDGYHTLIGSEAIKNKPKWRAELGRKTETSTLIIDESFATSTNWTKTGTKFHIANGVLKGDDFNTDGRHNLRYNTDLSTLIHFWETDWYLDFEYDGMDVPNLPEGKRRAPLIISLTDQQKQAGEGMNIPQSVIQIIIMRDRMTSGEGLTVNLSSWSRFDPVWGWHITQAHTKLAESAGIQHKIYCTLAHDWATGMLKLYIYKDSARTEQYGDSPLEVSTEGMYFENPDGSWILPQLLRWLTVSNKYYEYGFYYGDGATKYNQTIELDNIKLYKHKKAGQAYYSPTIDTVTIYCKTKTESGVDDGDIDTYTAPDGISNKLDIKFSRESRLTMLQQLLSASPTAETTENPSPTWDCWIETKEDKSAKLNYEEFHNINANYIITRKGELEGDNYIKSISKELDFATKLNSLHLVGGGWSAGITALQLFVNRATDEVKNKTMVEYAGKIISRRVRAEPYLEAISYTLLKLLKNVKNTYDIVPYPEWRDKFTVGDFVTVEDLETKTSEKLRIREENWKIGVSEETLNLILESGATRIEKYLGEFITNQRANSTISQGAVTSPPVSYNDNYDVYHPPELWFYIPKNKKISKVSLFLKNQRFRAYSKSAKGESAHTHEQIAHSHIVEGVIVDGTVIAIGASSEDRAEQGTSHIISVRSGSQQISSVNVWSTVSTWTAGQAYDVEDLLHSITYTTNTLSTATAYDISWRIRHVRGASSWYYPSSVGNMTKISNYKRGAETEMLQPRAIQSGDQLILQRFATGAALLNKYIYWSWQIAAYDSRHSHAIAGEGVDATVIAIGETTEGGGDDITETGSIHSHDIDFGIYEYPYYAPSISMYVNKSEIPSSIFGKKGTEGEGFETVGLDITPDFDLNADGIVDTGWHVIRFIPNTLEATNNIKGLGRMMVYLGFEEVSI